VVEAGEALQHLCLISHLCASQTMIHARSAWNTINNQRLPSIKLGPLNIV
jgi:hypothetical protein